MTIKELNNTANQVRKLIINMLSQAGSGHTAGSLDLADIVTALYFEIMNIDPNDPNKPDRDIFILSNGHTVPVQYATMAKRGFIDESELSSLRKLGTRLQGHPERTKLAGLENTSGPLGSGLSQAVGCAYSFQYLDSQKHRFVYVVMGDGELDEGNIWEAAMLAGKYKLSQLIAFVDRNDIQIDGNTETVMPLEDLKAKWQAFGWYVIEIDGHNMKSIIDAVNLAKAITNRPCVIIAHTIASKGIKFMEYDYTWHGKAPDEDQARQAISELEETKDE